MTTTEVIGRWIASERHEISEAATRIAARSFFDTITCIIAGLSEPPVLATAALARAFQPGAATALPGLHTASPWAALVHGTAAHVLDFDDAENIAFTHPSAVLVPALLALGEERTASGRDLIEAYAVGYEVLIRIGEWIGLDHYRIGWHSTSTTAAFGAAAACCRLIGLDAERSAAALSIGSSMIGGFRCQFGTMVKPLHAGLAAKNGIQGTLLAEAGMTGSPDALDGPHGFAAMMTEHGPSGGIEDTTRFARPWAIEAWPPTVKRFASCGATHGTLDAVLDLQAEHRFRADDVTGIETELPDISASALCRPPPTNPMEARFSLEHCVAAALHRHGLTLDDFREETIHRDDIRRLRDRVHIDTYPGDGAYRNGAYVVRTTVRLKDGRHLYREILHKKGMPENPLSEADLMAKFRICMSGPYGLTDADRVAAELFDFASVASVPEILAGLDRRLFRR